jgi:hypothetical protein
VFKTTALAVVFAVPVFSNQGCDGCNPGGSGGGGAPDTGTPDTGTVDPCAGYVGQGTAAALDATPRARPDLEQLAIALQPGFTADQGTYDRLLADTTAMGGLQSRVADITYRAGYPGDELVVSADSATLSAMQGGSYTDWDCANDWYGLTGTSYSVDFAVLQFPGTFDIPSLATEYAAFPGVTAAEPDYLAGDGPSLCVTPAGTTWNYVFDDASGDCPSGCIDHAYFYFTSEADGSVAYHGSWDGSGPATSRPAWVNQYAHCD